MVLSSSILLEVSEREKLKNLRFEEKAFVLIFNLSKLKTRYI